MGLFSNGNDKSVHIIRELADNANDTKNEINNIMKSFENEHSNSETLTEEFGKFAADILEKLELEDGEKLVDFVEKFNKFHSHYLQNYSSIIELSTNQTIKTNSAIAHYEKLSK